MQGLGGGAPTHGLDARLLRFRSRPGSEDGARLAEDLLAAGRSADAAEVAETAHQANPHDGRVLLVQGRAWLHEGEYERAQAALVSAARVDPTNKNAFRWLAEVLLKRGDPLRAQKVVERGLALDPGDAALTTLHERAVRFSRLAQASGLGSLEDDTFARSVQIDDDGDEELTAARFDVSAHLAMDPAARGPDAAPPADRRPALPQLSGPSRAARQAVPIPPAPAAAWAREEWTSPTIAQRPSARAALRRSDSPLPPPPAAPSRIVSPYPPPFGAAPPPSAPPPSPFKRPASAPPPPLFSPPPQAPPPARFAPWQDQAPVPQAPPPMAIPPAPAVPRGGFESFEPPSFDSNEVVSTESDEENELTHVDVDDSGHVPVDIQPDMRVGDLAGSQEDADGVLRMLEREGIFEAPRGEPAVWADPKQARRRRGGSRIGRTVAVAWIVAIGLVAGGYYAWEKWIQQRQHEAKELVRRARIEAFAGDHADLVSAERNLRIARDLAPHDKLGPTLMLFVHAQRALEDGQFDAGFLRPTIERARRLGADEAYRDAARGVLLAAEGDPTLARRSVERALRKRGDDAAILYIAGRLEQRLGDDDALANLGRAIERNPTLVAASIALAEAKADEGNREEALSRLDAVLARLRDHLRARLWRAFMSADEVAPDEGLRSISTLARRLDLGAPTDVVLVELTRARLLRRKSDMRGAGEAIERASRAGASEPRLLALVAQEARGAGKLARAQIAAMQAVQGAPSNADFRKILATILVERREGMRALSTLNGLSPDDPDVILLTAKAAIQVGTEQALQAAIAALDRYITVQQDSVEAKALRIRARVALGQIDQAMSEARALSRAAPGDPLVSLALGEAALAKRDAPAAQRALTQLVQALPDDAEAHYLLGRARRMGGDFTGSEQSLRRALALAPEHVDAGIALGRLLLDDGKWEEADRIYQDLSRRAGVASGSATALVGRLGRIEALLGLGRVEDARVQLEGIRPQDRDLPIVRVAAAKVAIARQRPGEAVTLLRPLAESEDKTAEVLALFGDALLGAGEVDAATSQYDAALDRDDALPEALLGRAKIDVRAQRAGDAVLWGQELEESLRSRVRPPAFRADVYLTMGRAHLQLGASNADRARAALRRATELDGVAPEAFFYLGEALAADNAPEARQAYERYLQLAPNGSFASRARRALGSR